jgi:hypothetical protein
MAIFLLTKIGIIFATSQSIRVRFIAYSYIEFFVSSITLILIGFSAIYKNKSILQILRSKWPGVF